MDPGQSYDRQVARVFVWTGIANLVVLAAKVAVGFATGSSAVLGDAVHSFADVSNNAVALLALHFASAPPDRHHPYGHRKYETLAVFALAVLLAVLAVEIALRGVGSAPREVLRPGWGLAVMLGVFATNAAVGAWQARWARRLDSDLLRADARHTISDLLVTASVIAGWQAAARGHAWLDDAAALAVAVLILTLAFGLFRRAIPVLVDESAADPEALRAAVAEVAGVRSTRRVRSRGRGREGRMDLVVTVDAALSTEDSHRIADEVERALAARFGLHDVTVHVEPHPAGGKR
jgi:cation diffusion facilitator family transporter